LNKRECIWSTRKCESKSESAKEELIRRVYPERLTGEIEQTTAELIGDVDWIIGANAE
jgi:hypothetical protein